MFPSTPEHGTYLIHPSNQYSGTKPDCFGHTRICTRVPQSIYSVEVTFRIATRLLSLVALVILGYVPGDPGV